MTEHADQAELLWHDLMQLHYERAAHRAGALYVIILNRTAEPQRDLALERLQQLIPPDRVIEAHAPGADPSGARAAALLALVAILVDDPDAAVMLLHSADAVPTSTSFREELAHAYLHTTQRREVVIAVKGTVLVATGRTLFRGLAREMPHFARLAAFYAGNPPPRPTALN